MRTPPFVWPTLGLLFVACSVRAQSADSVSRRGTMPRHLLAVQPFVTDFPFKDTHVGGATLRYEHRLTDGFTLGLRASLYSLKPEEITHHSYQSSTKYFTYEGGLAARYYFGRRAPRGFYAEWGLYLGERHRESTLSYYQSPPSTSHAYDQVLSYESGAGYQWVLFGHAVLDLGLRVRHEEANDPGYTGTGVVPTVGLGIAF